MVEGPSFALLDVLDPLNRRAPGCFCVVCGWGFGRISSNIWNRPPFDFLSLTSNTRNICLIVISEKPFSVATVGAGASKNLAMFAKRGSAGSMCRYGLLSHEANAIPHSFYF